MQMFWYTVGFSFVGISVAFQNPILFWLSIIESFAIACQSEFTVPGILLVTFTPFLTIPAVTPATFTSGLWNVVKEYYSWNE